MFCKNCGKEIDDNAYVCPYCGVRTETTSVTGQSATNGFAIAGFVLSFFVSLLGLIFSIIGLKKSKECNSGRGLAIAGIIISVASWVIYIILYVTVFAAMFAGIASGAGL